MNGLPAAGRGEKGYAGWVGLEYKPTTASTEASLEWLPREQRAAA